tara:strand:- start:449 stop:622 length:174 start_codon:yes stop_codon:yes gene_type:complete
MSDLVAHFERFYMALVARAPSSNFMEPSLIFVFLRAVDMQNIFWVNIYIYKSYSSHC